MMTRPPDGFLLRFTPAERWVHGCTAALLGVCVVSAAMLYIGPLASLVGRRAVVEWVHVIAGIALPLPFVIGLASKAFRRDVRLIDRFSQTDWRWLRDRNRRSANLPVGKFNAGQKLNANFQLGAILVMLGTGCVMRFGNGWRVQWRTGATFVHDWLAYAVVLVVAGHIAMALRDPSARRGMRTGYVPKDWADAEHRGWAREHHT
jgi:formate dehydrogenase subunit gamma